MNEAKNGCFNIQLNFQSIIPLIPLSIKTANNFSQQKKTMKCIKNDEEPLKIESNFR